MKPSAQKAGQKGKKGAVAVKATPRPSKPPGFQLQGPLKQKTAKVGLHESDVFELREAFNALDTEHKGSIQPKELIAAMKSLNVGSWSPTTQHLLDHLIQRSETVDFDTFLEAVLVVLGDKDRRNGINKVFDFFDPEQSGFISVENMRRIAAELGEEISDSDLSDMITKASSNGTAISREDFYTIFTKRVFP